MEKRILAILLTMVMLISMVSVAGVITASAAVATITYTKTQSVAGEGVISATDNILSNADFKAFRIGQAASGSVDLPATLTDGAFSTADKKVLQAGKTADIGGHTYIYVWYRMPQAYDITSVYYGGDGVDGANSIAVYVGNEEIAAAQNGTVEPAVKHDGAVGTSLVDKSDGIAAIRFDFDQPISAKNIIFRLETCSNAGNEAVWVSEFGVAGAKSPVQTTPYTSKDAVQGAIDAMKADNILKKGTIKGEYKKPDGNLSGAYDTNIKDATNLTDGTYGNKSTMGAEKHGGVHTYAYIVCDLGKVYDVTSLLYTTDGSEGVNGLAIYVGDDTLSAIHEGNVQPVATYGAVGRTASPYTPGVNGELAVKFDFSEPISGRYIIYRLTTGTNNSNEMVWIGEIAALGTTREADAPYTATPYNKNTVANSVPAAADNILSKADATNLRYAGVDRAGFHDSMMGVVLDGAVGFNTEAIAPGVGKFADYATGGTAAAYGVNATADGGHTYVYFTYDMTNVYDVTSLYYACSWKAASDASWGTNGLAVYVGNDLAAVHDGTAEPSAVYDGTIGKTYVAGDDSGMRAVRFDFNEPVSGRYITFRLLSCTNSDSATKGEQVWISEFAALGTTDAPEDEEEPPVDPEEGEVAQYEFTATTYNLADTPANIPAASDNLLAGAADAYYRVNTNASGARDDKLTGALVDGTMSADNAEKMVAHAGKTAALNGHAYIYVMYDLKSVYDIRSLFFAGDGADGANSVAVYVGYDELSVIQAGDISPAANYKGAIGTSLVDTSTGAASIRFDFNEPVSGRYITFRLKTCTNAGNEAVWISELAALGAKSTVEQPGNLIGGKDPILSTAIDAHGIDNKTAVDAEGNPGTGNTGKLTNEQPFGSAESLLLLTDGDATQDSRWTAYVRTGATGFLQCDTPWAVLAYQLDGYSRIDEIVLTSTKETDYYIAGVQYYASEKYADLFKNESLLYTTGGERYIIDEEKSNAANTAYMPDPATDCNGDQVIKYKLTAEQKTKEYRYVAIVVTRPYGVWQKSKPGNRLNGYNMARINEIEVVGSMMTPVAPVPDTYSCVTSVGEVTVRVGKLDYDEREFFENTLGGVKVTETKLPASVNPHINSGWLSVDKDIVFTFELLDKNGNPIPEYNEDETLGLNGREVEYSLPSTADYVQTMAVLENGVLRRLYNSGTDVAGDKRLSAGAIDYPKYDENVPNNRDKAILNTAKVSLVYMKANRIDRVNELNNLIVTETLSEFMGKNVAGATTETASPLALWFSLPVIAVAAVVVLILLRRKARRAGQ